MKLIIRLMFIYYVFFLSGCMPQPGIIQEYDSMGKENIIDNNNEVTTERESNCPLPNGYQLKPALITAEQTLRSCPDKFDSVFFKLLDIAKDSRDKKNSILIQKLLKKLIMENKISKRYARTLYRKYFSVKFSLPSITPRVLPRQLDSIKSQIVNELNLKKIGMIECCGDTESYQIAEKEYIRIINFLENLSLNEEYIKNN